MSKQAVADGTDEVESISVTHLLDSGKDGEPYAAIVRFTGRRVGIPGKPTARNSFVKEETIERVVPGSGPLSITTWVDDLTPGEWTVTADLIRRASGSSGRPQIGVRPTGTATLPRAAWSWRRWALSDAAFTPVRTRWWPMARFTRMPAVIHGSWTGLVALGVVVGTTVQGILLGREHVPIGQALVVDLLALLSGLAGAKLWYLARQPHTAGRSPVDGWSVDGLLVVAPVVGISMLLAFNLPIGQFLDASVPGLFFGVAIGRLGCFFTGCCAGRCTRSRWGIWSSDRRVGARRIPTQLLESVAGLLIGGATLALVVRDAASISGSIFVASFAAYVLVRQGLLRLRAAPHKFSIRPQLTAAAAAAVLLGDVATLAFGAR
jgi:phosphatidylglycerol:prolipoprotein diacylglycerol transferase